MTRCDTKTRYFCKKFVNKSLAQGVTLCHTHDMNTQNTKSKSEGLRLSHKHWPMLRALMQSKGRDWLEKLIERHFKAMK